MAKRKLELDDLDSVDEPIPHASIHGVVKSISTTRNSDKCGYPGGLVRYLPNLERMVKNNWKHCL